MKLTHEVGPVMVACCLATQSQATVIPVPNGSFEKLYKPGSTTITADTGGNWTHGVGPNADMENGPATYSDTTTGNKVDIPGWVNATGWLPSYNWPSGCGNISKNGAQDGSYKYAANGTSWGNNNGGAVESDAALTTVVSGETYTLSVYATDYLTVTYKVLDLLADGVALTPDATSDTPAGGWTKTTKIYTAASLASHVGESLKIRVGWAAGAAGGQGQLDNVSLTSFADSTPPTLNSIVDDRSGAPVVQYRPVTYTLTFSEDMNASTIDATDFENASPSTITVNSVAATANPAVFLVTVTPTEAGTLHLQIKAGATLKDTGGNSLDTSSAIRNDTPIIVNADTIQPTLSSFVDNKSGGPIVINQTVTYTVTFDEAMNASTVDATDFGNASPTATTIGSVTPTANPAVFLVEATPTAAGTLQLRIKAGATLTDLKGNALETSAAIPDDTTIVVNTPPILVCPLGVLNLSANGGINPATGNLWQAGDKYRLIFVTSGVTACDSTDISTYNTFVQGLATASTTFPALGSVTWKVVGSTATVAARDNTGTTPGGPDAGEPIFRMDGSFAIAINYADLWNGIVASHVTGQNYLAVHLDENAAQILDERVRTGSVANGTASATQELGTGDVQTGRNYAPNGYGSYGGNGWMADWHASGPGRVYAISEPLTLQVAPPSNTFTTWANANNATGQTPGQDHDNDGVPNGIEYFMGQTGSSFTAMPGLDGTNTVTWTMSANYQGTYEVQTSLDLSTWTNVDPKPTPSGDTLSCTLPSGLGKQFVRLLVTPTP